ncbi:F-box protein At5g49610-like [Tasmannia lanceolata]|uniref:F-box protein At5g49610-like n=1 Tax=Tasmannia lanceolata TaxID=3420 RepID=UPI00406349F1
MKKKRKKNEEPTPEKIEGAGKNGKEDEEGLFFHKLVEYVVELKFTSPDQKSHGVPDPSLGFLGESVEIKAYCRGLVCCKSCRPNNPSCYICNPAIKEWRFLPNPPQHHYEMPEIVLVFDLFDVPASYKLVFIIRSITGFEFEIFESKTDKWIIPKVTFDDDVVSFRHDSICSTISVRGIIYWFVRPAFVIISFDTDRNSCRSLPLPKLTAQERGSQAWVGELEGCLSYTKVVKTEGEGESVDLE